MNDKKPLLIKKVTVQRLEVSDEVSLRARRAKQSQNVIASSLSLLAMTQLLPRTELLLKKLLFTALFFCLTCLNARAEIIFEDNFDNQSDWTLAQSTTEVTTCISGCNVPSGWNGYYNGGSWCSGGPGHNTLNLNSTNARGGSGKGFTFWDESCTTAFENSDGNLGKIFNQEYNEVYIRFFIKFQPNFHWQEGAPQHKLMHVQQYCGTGLPWSYFGNDCNKPVAVPGIQTYAGSVYYYIAYRCEEDYYCQGTPSYQFDVGTDMDQVKLGPWSTTLGDGQWHSMEFYFKMNTNNGATFNADGTHRFWLDGVLKYESTNIPYSDNGSTQSPRRGFNFFSIGGNNNNLWTTSCTGTACEQFYAIDDIVVSVSYIGPNYTIGLICDLNSDGKIDITDIQACVNHVLGVQDWGIKADVNSDGSVNVQDVQMIVNTILGG